MVNTTATGCSTGAWTPSTDIKKGAAATMSDKVGGDGGNFDFGGTSTTAGFLCPKGAYITHLDGGWHKNSTNAMNLFRFTCSDGSRSRDAGSGGSNAWSVDDPNGFLGVTENYSTDYVRSARFMGASGGWANPGGPIGAKVNDFYCPGGQRLVGLKGQVGSSNTGVIYNTYYMCDWPVDCTDGVKNTWNTDCDKFGLVGDEGTQGAIWSARKKFCNADATVNDSKCDSFCSTWPDSCQSRKDCALTGLTGASCTAANVSNLKLQCSRQGITVGGLGQGSLRPCTQTSLDALNAECDAYNIPRGEACTANAVDVAKTQASVAAASASVIAAQSELAAKNARDTAATANAFIEAMKKPITVVADDSPPTATAAATGPNYLLFGGIGAACLCCLLLICCLLMMSK